MVTWPMHRKVERDFPREQGPGPQPLPQWRGNEKLWLSRKAVGKIRVTLTGLSGTQTLG